MAVEEEQIVLRVGDGAVYQPHFILGQFGLFAGDPGKVVRRHQPKHGQTVRGQIAQIFRLGVGQINVALLVTGKGDGIIVHFLGKNLVLFLHGLLHPAQDRLPGYRRADLKNHLSGAVRTKRVVYAEPQGEGREDHHQHHGGKNGHVGQPHRVLLHAVDHAGHVDEMGGLAVVEAPVLPQQLQQGDAARREQQVRAENDADHRYKEKQHGSDRVRYGNADVVARAQKEQPQHGQQPVGPRLPFADLAAPQQLDGVGKMNLADGVEQDQQEDHADDQRRTGYHAGKDLEGKARYSGAQQLHQQQEHQLVKQNAQADPQYQTDQQQNQRFTEDHQRNMLLAHAQNVQQAEFLFAPFHQETVGVKKKDHRKEGRDQLAQLQSHQKIAGTKTLIGRKRRDHIQHHGGQDGGKQIGIVDFPVFADVARRQLPVKALTHGTHRLS